MVGQTETAGLVAPPQHQLEINFCSLEIKSVALVC